MSSKPTFAPEDSTSLACQPGWTHDGVQDVRPGSQLPAYAVPHAIPLVNAHFSSDGSTLGIAFLSERGGQAQDAVLR